MPVTCPNCGRETERREKFCDACGAFLGWDAGQSADSQLFAPQAPQPDEQRAGVQIQIRNGLIEVAPGNAESTPFTIKNLGTQVEEFRFSVAGPDWLVAEPATVSVYPGQEATGAVQAAPPRTSSSIAGVTPFQLTATSALHAHVSGSAAGRVDVAPYYELAAELIPTSSHGRRWTRHHIALDNRGNVPLRIPLSPTDVADGLRLDVPAVAEVAPGEVTEVPVAVHGPFRWFGRPEPKTFSVIAEAPKPLAPARLPGTRIVTPLLPRWAPVAAAALLAAGAAAAVVATRATAKHGPTHPTSSSSTSPAARSSAAPSPSSSASPTSSSSSSSSSSVSVSVPDVTGETLQEAETALRNQHLVPQPQAFYSGPSATAGNVVRTSPAANVVVPPGSTVQVLVPTGTTDLVSAAPSAQWTASSQFTPPTANLQFGGPENNSAGAVLRLPQVALEDRTMAAEALETHPPPVMNAFITGVYTLPAATIAGEQFRADIGFRQGTGAKIRYQVIAVEAGGPQRTVADDTHDAGTGRMANVHVDLPPGTTHIALRVIALDLTPAQDDAVLGRPRHRGSERPHGTCPINGPAESVRKPDISPYRPVTGPVPGCPQVRGDTEVRELQRTDADGCFAVEGTWASAGSRPTGEMAVPENMTVSRGGQRLCFY